MIRLNILFMSKRLEIIKILLRFDAVIVGEVQIRDENENFLSTDAVQVQDYWQNRRTVSSDMFELQKGKQKIKTYNNSMRILFLLV